MTNCVGNLREIFFCLSEGLQNMNACSNHHSRASNHSSQASSQLFRASKKPSQVCNNPSQLRLKPGMDGRTDKQMKVPVFYGTLFPSGPLPCLPLPQIYNHAKQGIEYRWPYIALSRLVFFLWQWRANLYVQTQSSRAGELDGNKRAGLRSSMGPSRGLKGPKTAKKSKILIFLVADTQLYKRLCPSVRPSFRPSFRPPPPLAIKASN